MVSNEYLLMCEARRRIIERVDQARQDALVAAARATRPPFRARFGEWLVRAGRTLQASPLGSQPARARGD